MTPESSLAAARSPRPAAAAAALHPSLVLSAYLEPLVRGRRVAVLGDATIGLAERLLQRGARLVHAYDPDAARVAEMLARSVPAKQPRPSFAVLDGDLGVRDGAFDTLIIPDLSLFDNQAELLRRARRLTAVSGAAVIASPNPDVDRGLLPAGTRRGAAPGYYALYDLVALQFKQVRMIGQAPFVGYTVAEFAPKGEPEVSVDTSILDGSEEPEWFIVVAGERLPRLDAFAVVELPFADVPIAGAGASPEALAQAQGLAARLGGELADLRTRHQRDREEAGARAESAVATAARLAEVEAELSAKGARLREVEARAGDAHVRAERLTHQIRDMEEELRHQRDRATRLAKQLDDEKRLRTKAELELGMIRNKPEIAGARDRLEAAMAELDAARARIAELEARSAAASPDPALVARVEQLEAAAAGARRELSKVTAERDAARKRAQESERALEEARRAAAKQQELEAARAELARERDRMRDRADRLERENRALGEERASLEARKLLLETRIVDLEQRLVALEARNAELEKGEAAAAEIARLEEALRERGHVIATLKAQLLESERVGKELVDELGTVFATAMAEHGGSSQAAGGGAGGIVPAGGAGDIVEALRQQLDALARSAAASEADLRAASWKIAQLERELAEAREAAGSPAALHAELEQALIAAQAEIAALRRAAERGGAAREDATQKSASAEAAAQENVSAEGAAQTGAEAAVQESASAEAAAQESASTEAAVQENVSAEGAAQTGAEAAVQENVSAEGAAQTGAEAAAQESVSAEGAAQTGAEAAAQENVSAEAAAQKSVSAEAAAQENVSAEGAAQTGAEAAAQENVTTEAAAQENVTTEAAAQENVSAECGGVVSNNANAVCNDVSGPCDDAGAVRQEASAAREDAGVSDEVGVPPEVIEQAVLLQQVANAVEAGA